MHDDVPEKNARAALRPQVYNAATDSTAVSNVRRPSTPVVNQATGERVPSMCPPHPPSSDTIDETLGTSGEEDADGAFRPIDTARVRRGRWGCSCWCWSVAEVVVVVVMVVAGVVPVVVVGFTVAFSTSKQTRRSLAARSRNPC